MPLDSALSLEVVITILAILGAVWRLETRIADTRRELKSDIQRLDAKIDETRGELKSDIQRLDAKIESVRHHLETRIDRLEIKIDDVDRRLGEKIDEGNQRLARLEGRFEGRAERLEAEGEADPAA